MNFIKRMFSSTSQGDNKIAKENISYNKEQILEFLKRNEINFLFNEDDFIPEIKDLLIEAIAKCEAREMIYIEKLETQKDLVEKESFYFYQLDFLQFKERIIKIIYFQMSLNDYIKRFWENAKEFNMTENIDFTLERSFNQAENIFYFNVVPTANYIKYKDAYALRNLFSGFFNMKLRFCPEFNQLSDTYRNKCSHLESNIDFNEIRITYKEYDFIGDFCVQCYKYDEKHEGKKFATFSYTDFIKERELRLISKLNDMKLKLNKFEQNDGIADIIFTLQYIETGKIKNFDLSNIPEEFELLDLAVNDLDKLYSKIL